MATHSSILAWRIPRTEEPGWLWSMGSQSVGINLATNTTLMMDSLVQVFPLRTILQDFTGGLVVKSPPVPLVGWSWRRNLSCPGAN